MKRHFSTKFGKIRCRFQDNTFFIQTYIAGEEYLGTLIKEFHNSVALVEELVNSSGNQQET